MRHVGKRLALALTLAAAPVLARAAGAQQSPVRGPTPAPSGESGAGAADPTRASIARARAVVESGIAAMGGLEALERVRDVTRELSGTRRTLPPPTAAPRADSAAPPAVSRVELTSVVDLSGGRIATLIRDTLDGSRAVRYRSVITPEVAFGTDERARAVRVLPAAAVAPLRASTLRNHPEGVLRAAWARRETLRWLGEAVYDGRRHELVSFADVDGAQVTLAFDAETKLLSRQETATTDPTLGVVVVSVSYEDWEKAGALLLPFAYEERVNGVVTFQEFVRAIALDASPSESVFALPRGYAPMPESGTVASRRTPNS